MHLDRADLIVIAVYLTGITLFGLRFRKKQRSLRDYFLADRAIPWWAIAISIVAAETSTLTIISIPGLAYDTNLAFLQVVIGYIVARIVISIVFVPAYFRGEMFTAYQLIERRFGSNLRSLAAGLFLITRAAAEGVRVFAVSIVIAIALGTGEIASIAIISVLTLIYTMEGGMAAVIWTDVIQMGIYISGTLLGFYTILHLVPGGWPAIHMSANEIGKMRVFDFTPSLHRTYTFWSGVIGGTFLTTASHGTDQLMVQRLLSAKNKVQSQIALLTSGVAIFFQFGLFLVLGVALFFYYQAYPPDLPFLRSDQIFPTFIVNELPRGVSGLLIAAILAAAMSNLSAALNSLSSSSILDFYLRRRSIGSEGRRLRLSRTATVLWAIVLFFLALLSRRGGRVVEVGLSIASVAYGAMLGIFLLGLLTKRANERGAMVGMAVGFALEVYVWQWTSIPWTWYVAIGAPVTFVIGYIASTLFVSPADSANVR